MTGDDVRMDVGLGLLGGSRTVLVRSGISGALDVSTLPERRRPHAVVDGVGELLAWLWAPRCAPLPGGTDYRALQTSCTPRIVALLLNGE